MDANLAQSTEIETIAEILPELTYYQILQVDPLAPTPVLEKAYRAEARRLHPDRYARNPNNEVKQKANQIYRAVMEAWNTLKDPESRQTYDQELEDGHRRMTEDAKKQAEAARRRRRSGRDGAPDGVTRGVKFKVGVLFAGVQDFLCAPQRRPRLMSQRPRLSSWGRPLTLRLKPFRVEGHLKRPSRSQV